MSYTAVPTVTTGELWTAANHNTYIRDNFAATRTVFKPVPAVGGWNTTDSIVVAQTSAARGFALPDNKTANINSYSYLDEDFAGSLSVYGVFIPNGTGNCYCQVSVELGAYGEDYQTHVYASSFVGVAGTSGYQTFTANLSCAAAAIGDNVVLNFIRAGGNASDTVNATVYGLGFILVYSQYANF